MGSFYMESTQINYRRDETVKTVDQKLQELSETSAIDTDIAPVFKSTNTYAPGDMVYYRNKLYVFNVEHTGAWAAADVTATDVTTELSSLKSGLTNLDVALSVPENSGKNVLPLTMDILKAKNTSGTWADNVYTYNNVVFTVNTDSNGYITGLTANGTANADTNFAFAKGATNIYNGYILNGCTGGNYNTYYLALSLNASPWTANTCYNSDTKITITNGVGIEVYVKIKSGYEASNVTISPMIRPATITDPTFAPYIPSVESRIEAVESGLIDVNSNLTSILNGKLNEHYITIGSDSSIYSYVRDRDTPQGISACNIQTAQDNPNAGNVTYALVFKGWANGNYSMAVAFADNAIWVSDMLRNDTSSFTWHRVTSTPVT